ncbi:hypothetical protein HY29_10870 [Hyphomonas beringensis]|uniref:Uncharacterized protein n=1 Tax=Hyphomonas beringensis TaxID=1280946 RepID=A0A062UGA5_9PROT|nr:hypothetical protein [Hyphomonas beringensis]KCZ55619.1 hypothetical protein HY29_10870 [Hyphomonas beringensis]
MKIIKPESALYPLVWRWLNSQFSHSELVPSFPGMAQIFTSNTSQAPAIDGGYWSRPDLAAMLYSRARFVPTLAASLYTFEIKTWDGISDSSVYEAIAHKRYANYSALVWQAEPKDTRNNGIFELCKYHGVGAVTAEDPSNPHDYIVHVAAERAEVDPFVIDQFVDRRFPREARMNMEKWLQEMGWKAIPREGII